MQVGLTVKGSEQLPSNDFYRERVLSLEAAMEREFGSMDNTDGVAPVNHYHCEGNYAREICIPKGVCIIGKIHKHEHINVISQGRCVVVTEAGREEYAAPKTFISSAGIKRAVYALEDTVWTTIHPTEETDLDKIEQEVIAKDYEDLNSQLRIF